MTLPDTKIGQQKRAISLLDMPLGVQVGGK